MDAIDLSPYIQDMSVLRIMWQVYVIYGLMAAKNG